MKYIHGTCSVRPNGSIWLVPDGPQKQPPLWIDPASAGSVMNGDLIQAEPVRRELFPRMLGARPDTQAVRLVKIVKRKRKWVVGVVQTTRNQTVLVPRDPLLREVPFRLLNPPDALKKMVGHLVVARIEEAHPMKTSSSVAARVSEDLGDPECAASDVPALLKDRGMSESFPAEVKTAAKKAFERLVHAGADPSGRVDLRKELIVAIDPATAHDHDDAVSISPLPGGRWKLGVHIADVAAYVPPDSAIDREALRRGNSTYLVDRVIRMLPKDLTVRVCSLLPSEDHLAHTVELTFDAQGRMLTEKTFRSIIRTRAILTYEQVQQFFETGRFFGGTPDLCSALRHLRVLAEKLRALRFENGALDFALPEVHCDLDDDGNPVGFTRRGSTEAYNLIEECMLAANQAVARKVHTARVPGIYRVHDEPSADQWARMAAELRALGHRSSPQNAKELNQMARSVLGKPEQYMTTLTLLRNMKRAAYDVECLPHFGLGFTHYAHFTSPIRRYPDLILHRILIALEEGQTTPAYSAAEIDALALHCAETERESAEMEGQSIQIKRIRYFAMQLEQGKLGPHQGTIISLNPKGLIVELRDSLQQGMLPYFSIGRDRFVLSPDGLCATAPHGMSFRLGQDIAVHLARVDESSRRVDFVLPSLPRQAKPALPAPKRMQQKRIDKPAHKIGNLRTRKNTFKPRRKKK